MDSVPQTIHNWIRFLYTVRSAETNYCKMHQFQVYIALRCSLFFAMFCSVSLVMVRSLRNKAVREVCFLLSSLDLQLKPEVTEWNVLEADGQATSTPEKVEW